MGAPAFAAAGEAESPVTCSRSGMWAVLQRGVETQRREVIGIAVGLCASVDTGTPVSKDRVCARRALRSGRTGLTGVRCTPSRRRLLAWSASLLTTSTASAPPAHDAVSLFLNELDQRRATIAIRADAMSCARRRSRRRSRPLWRIHGASRGSGGYPRSARRRDHAWPRQECFLPRVAATKRGEALCGLPRCW